MSYTVGVLSDYGATIQMGRRQPQHRHVMMIGQKAAMISGRMYHSSGSLHDPGPASWDG